MNENEILHQEICQGVNFTYIPDNKFKTSLISFSMFTPLSEREVSKNAIIPSLLSHSCKKFPKISDVSIRLEELYGSSIHSSISKFGDSQVLTLSAVGLNSAFTQDNTNNIADLANLLCEMIFNPDIENESFKKENVDQEKRQIIEDILSEMSDKRLYARKRCREIMCKEEKFGINSYGTIEAVKEIDGKESYKTWKKLLGSSRIEITMIGCGNYTSIISEFKERFSNIERHDIVSCETEIIKKAENINEVVEEMDVTQCKLVMGLRTEVAYPDKEVPSVILMNALFGGTAQSKLFVNVREKLSLCYYCSSKYNRHKGIMFIESGVEQDKISEAKKEIMKQLKEIKIGNFTDAEFSETKLYLSQNIKSINDSLSALNDWYVLQAFSENIKSPETFIKEINEVSRESVIEVANKVTLDTIYLLSSKEKKEEN